MAIASQLRSERTRSASCAMTSWSSGTTCCAAGGGGCVVGMRRVGWSGSMLIVLCTYPGRA